MAIKFETNIPLKVRFPFGDFREVNSHYGQQFAYSVDHAGQRDKLFATPGLHHKLQEAGVRAGAEFTITKIENENNRKGWRIEGEEAPAPVAVVQQQGAQSNGKPAPAAPDVARESAADPDFERLCQTMRHCLSAAYRVWEGLEVDLPFTTEDVRCVGVTLFIECEGKGIVPQVSGEGLPF